MRLAELGIRNGAVAVVQVVGGLKRCGCSKVTNGFFELSCGKCTVPQHFAAVSCRQLLLLLFMLLRLMWLLLLLLWLLFKLLRLLWLLLKMLLWLLFMLLKLLRLLLLLFLLQLL
jgi:hypothetical protein